MAEDLAIIGGGGFGRETADVVDAVNAASDAPPWRLVGIVDDGLLEDNASRLGARGIPHLGSLDDLITSAARPRYVVGIGAPAVRRRISDRLDEAGFSAATLIHPQATVGSQVTIGEGTVICAGARLATNLNLGRHNHINPNATVGHDSVLRSFVSLNPGATVSGECEIGEGVLVGAGATVLNQLQVGQGAVLGAGACVVRAVAPAAIVKGVPAR